MQKPLAIGIDLGTSNCAVAVAFADNVQPIPLEQLEDAKAKVALEVLPSLLYLPLDNEVDLATIPGLAEIAPWVVGRYTKSRLPEVPDRVVASAKSWLCATHMDREAPLLPWGSEVSPKISPVQATALILRFLVQSANKWLEEHSGQRVTELPITITVPASFDEVARQLTVKAANEADLGEVTLLEEPIAAFYAYLQSYQDSRRDSIQPGDLVLVCDVGGGTSDFSLIAATDVDGVLKLERISVGRHLLLGGDNMDLALAVQTKNRLESEGQSLDRWQFLSLVGMCKQAKEQLLAPDGPNEVTHSIAARGSSLFASAISFSLSKADVTASIVDGFFPLTNLSARPGRGQLGLQELGLHYETDAVLTKHLAEFLGKSYSQVEQSRSLKEKVGAEVMRQGAIHSALLPTHLLFNGGVFHAECLRHRVVAQLKEWRGGDTPKLLEYVSLDSAVAVGAAFHSSLSVTGSDVRIGAGTVANYYVGLESAGLAVPGMLPEVKGLCVVPKGTEEATTLPLPDRQFGLVIGQKAQFRFFSAADRGEDQVGTLVGDAERHLEELPPLAVTMAPTEQYPDGTMVPVTLEVEVTAVGTIKLVMCAVKSADRWGLEFDMRNQGDKSC